MYKNTTKKKATHAINFSHHLLQQIYLQKKKVNVFIREMKILYKCTCENSVTLWQLKNLMQTNDKF